MFHSQVLIQRCQPLLALKLKLTEGQTAGRDYNLEGIEELCVHLQSDAILELRSDGGVLYDSKYLNNIKHVFLQEEAQ